jgi:predicted nucleotidyltransferase
MKTKLSKTLSYFPNITFALLFGSYANDTQKELSDIDVAIFVDKPIDLFVQGEIIATLECELEKKIDLVILNDLYKSHPKLSFNITNNHKVIFCQDDALYADFKVNSLKYYLDVKCMLDMFDDALKERLQNGTYGKIKIEKI